MNQRVSATVSYILAAVLVVTAGPLSVKAQTQAPQSPHLTVLPGVLAAPRAPSLPLPAMIPQQSPATVAPLIAAIVSPPQLPITDDAAAEHAFGRQCLGAAEAPWQVRIEEKYSYPASGDPLDRILPNTRTYVTNTDSCPCLGGECREDTIQYRVTLEGAAPQARWSGAIRAGHADGRTLYRALNPGGVGVCLPEGRYRLATKVWTEDRNCTTAEQEVTLVALVIATLGDSYSAGEGTPSARVTASQWPFVADRHKNDSDKLVPQGSRVLALWQRQSTLELPIRDEGTRVVPARGWTAEAATHFEAHRSPFAPASLFAMEVEQAAPTSNVTFVNLAESGATIEKGALYAGCIPETDCAATFDRSQLDRLKELLEGRNIDALVLGFGGNDAGFARVGAAYVLREPKLRELVPDYDYPSETEIRDAIRSGDWSAALAPEERDVKGMDQLEGQYAELDNKLRTELSNEISRARIFLLGYPALHKKRGPEDRTESFCEFLGNIAPFLDERANRSVTDTLFGFVGRVGLQLGIIFGDLVRDNRVRLRVDEDEAMQIHIDFYKPLMEFQERAARTHGWEYVRMPSTFEDHHICAGRPYEIHRSDSYRPRLPPPAVPNRWFRAGIEGFLITGIGQRRYLEQHRAAPPQRGGLS